MSTTPIVYLYSPSTHEYTQSVIVDASPEEQNVWIYPAFSTIEIPPEHQEKTIPIWTEDHWEIVADHRGETWFDRLGNLVLIDFLGNPKDKEFTETRPELPEPKIIPESINRRQFFQQAYNTKILTDENETFQAMTGVIPETLQRAIKTLPEASQFPAKALIVGAQTFERTNPLTALVAKSLGLDEAQIEQFWFDAAKL